MAKQIQWEEVGATSHALLSPGYVTAKNSQTLYTSGCVGSDPKTGEIPDCIEAQTRNALENLKAILKAGGSSLDSVLKVLIFVSHGTYAAGFNKVYKEYFPGKPARSCVVVAFPDPSLKVELECVAAVEE